LQSFFKLLLDFFVRLGMSGPWHQFAPAMTMKQAVNRAIIDRVPDLCLKSPLDFGCGGNLSGLGTCEEGSQEALFFFQA
jgi:hypothetical protein